MGGKRKPKPKPPPEAAASPSLPLLKTKATSAFNRDYKRMKKRGKDMAKLTDVMAAIGERKTLGSKYHDHALIGRWIGYRECHVEPDWLLVYELTETAVTFAATGTHADLRLE